MESVMIIAILRLGICVLYGVTWKSMISWAHCAGFGVIPPRSASSIPTALTRTLCVVFRGMGKGIIRNNYRPLAVKHVQCNLLIHPG